MKFGSDNYMKQKPHHLWCGSSPIGLYIKNKCSELRSMNVVRFETV